MARPRFNLFFLNRPRLRLPGGIPWLSVAVPMGAVALALLLGAFLLWFVGVDPAEAYKYLIIGNFQSAYTTSEVLTKATPLIMTGLAFSFAYRTGLFNIGGEGQMFVGALATVVVGLQWGHLSPWVVIPTSLMAALLAGAMWGGIPGLLKARYGSSEIIVTIMLNYVAVYFLNYVVDKPLREASGTYPQTDPIGAGAFLPAIIPDTRLHLGFLIALAFAALFYVILWKTPLGFELRTVGYNPTSAEYAGINVKRKMALSLALSGALAGAAGFTEVNGIHHRVLDDFSRGVGFDGIAVALLGGATPVGVVVSSIWFGMLQVGATIMQRRVAVPANIVYVIQALVILFVLGGTMLARRLEARRQPERSEP